MATSASLSEGTRGWLSILSVRMAACFPRVARPTGEHTKSCSPKT